MRFEGLPDLAALTPTQEGPSIGLLDPTIRSREPILVAYEGVMQVPTNGAYRFDVALDWITGDPNSRIRG